MYNKKDKDFTLKVTFIRGHCPEIKHIRKLIIKFRG